MQFEVHALAEFEGTLFAAGHSPPPGGGTYSVTRVARWNGAAWEELPAPAPWVFNYGWARALHVHDGQLFIGGMDFVQSPVHRWNGQNWSPVGTSSAWATILSLTSFDGALHAGGSGPSPLGISAVARWNGADWVPLGQVVGAVSSMIEHEGQLVIGGSFSIDGGPNRFWARWGCPCYADCTNDGRLTVADFGCFQTQFVLAHPYTDCNSDGALTVADFGCFQTKFVQGCP